jgi:hypothetical protein
MTNSVSLLVDGNISSGVFPTYSEEPEGCLSICPPPSDHAVTHEVDSRWGRWLEYKFIVESTYSKEPMGPNQHYLVG